jgi:hypothetical protein
MSLAVVNPRAAKPTIVRGKRLPVLVSFVDPYHSRYLPKCPGDCAS